MRRIEKEEERLGFTEPDKQCFHLCIVNLGIGQIQKHQKNLLKYTLVDLLSHYRF